MLIHDIYLLGESDPFSVKNREEVSVNLELKKAPPCYSTLLTGEVLCGHLPIKNASVLVMDEYYAPLTSSLTDERGIFKFVNVLKPGMYYAAASAAGYVTSDAKTVNIRPNETSRLSFALKRNHMYVKGLIYGKVLESGSGKPIEGADVHLKSLKPAGAAYKTRSNRTGQYLIYGIIPDEYKMTVQKQCYIPAEPVTLTVEKHSRICMYFDLIRTASECKNTISGVIRCGEEPIREAAVFLYSIDRERNERIVQMQETNENGLFLFANVESGAYIVKGNVRGQRI